MFKNLKLLIKGLCVLSVLSLTTVGNANAQFGDAGEIIKAGATDANSLMNTFLSPYVKGFGADLNTGWFNTAKSHQTLGFDLSLNVAASVVPSDAMSMNINDDFNFEELELTQGSPETPTIAGATNTDTFVGVVKRNPVSGQDEVVTEFQLPAGTGFEYAPSPMIQASVGIIKDTDISLRFVPEVTVPEVDVNVGLFGFGVKHGLNQWIPGGKVLPVDLSVQFGYTSFSANAGFNVDPEVPQGGNAEIENTYPASTWDGQGLEMETSATTINAIVGKTLPIISVYGGVGYESSTTTISTPGSYPITSFNPDYPNNSSQPKRIEAIDAPIDLEIEGDNSVRAFVGTRIRITVIQIVASYTLADYSSFNVGFGFSLR